MGTNIFIGGLVEGINFPKGKFSQDKPFIDLDGCNDIMVVGRKYFIANEKFLYMWALEKDGESKKKTDGQPNNSIE